MLFAIRCSMSYWMLYLSFQRADQRVSIVARSILVVFAVIGVLSVVLTLAKVIIWLDFLYICSYIKLSITLIKYVPQVSVRERKLARLHSFRGVFWHSFFHRYSGIHELPKKEYARMEHWKCITRLYRWHTKHAPNDIECIQSW